MSGGRHPYDFSLHLNPHLRAPGFPTLAFLCQAPSASSSSSSEQCSLMRQHHQGPPWLLSASRELQLLTPAACRMQIIPNIGSSQPQMSHSPVSFHQVTERCYMHTAVSTLQTAVQAVQTAETTQSSYTQMVSVSSFIIILFVSLLFC